MCPNLISQAIEVVGLAKLARALGVTYQAIRKWEARGRLPRTEWTGETDYAALIETATEGKVSKVSLLATPLGTDKSECAKRESIPSAPAVLPDDGRPAIDDWGSGEPRHVDRRKPDQRSGHDRRVGDMAQD